MMIDVDWRQPFIDYLSEQKVPSDKNSAEQLIRRAKSYVLVGDKLYKRGASSRVLMKCVPRQEGKDILEEIHKGVCGNHVSSRTLVSKAFRRAFYWPTALGDAEELVRRCQGCQYFAKQQHVPAYKLVTIPPTWPFACWGLDMMGPLPVSGLLLSRIQPARLPTDPGLRRATKDSSSGLLRDHVLQDPAYMATYGSTAVRGYSP
jgi:hypothetical protein